MTQYRALTGIDYPPNKRVEAGTIVTDLPEKSTKWLLDQGLIELADGKTNISVPAKVEFKPDAVDGDGDGFLQDGTPFMRPVKEKE